MRRSCIAVAATLWLLAPAVAFAQVDLSGQWAAINQQDNMTRGAGPDLADYTGLPINDEARAAALSYTSGVLSMTERGCTDYTENYLLFAPHNIVIERVNDPVTGDILAWKISAGGRIAPLLRSGWTGVRIPLRTRLTRFPASRPGNGWAIGSRRI